MNILLINQCAANKGDRTVMLYILKELARNNVKKVSVAADNPKLLENISDYKVGIPVEFLPWGHQITEQSNGCILTKKYKSLTNKFILNKNFKNMKKAVFTGNHTIDLRLEKRFLAAITDADLVISTGGHHVTSLLIPEALSPQTHDICAAILYGKPLALWSQSIGPFNFTDDSNRKLIQWMLSKANGIYVRDRKSISEIAALEISPGSVNIIETYESVIGLNDMIRDYTLPSKREPFIGISIYHVMKRSRDVQENYIHSMAALVDWIIAEGYIPRLFPMEMKGAFDDRGIICQILQASKHGNEEHLLDEDLEPSEHIQMAAACQAFIGHKTHSAIIALMTGTPLLGIAYHKKTEDFMNQYGMSDYCIPDTQIGSEILIDKTKAILMESDILGKKTFNMSRSFCEKIRSDFTSMLRLVNN